MPLPRPPLFLALLTAILAAAPAAFAAQPPKTPEAPKTPKAPETPEAPEAPETDVQKWVEILRDTTQSDEARVKAREGLVSQGAAAELVQLGKEAKNANVRLHVAIALSQLTEGRDAIAADVGLLTEWLKAKDPVLRYWTIQAMANARDPEVDRTLSRALTPAEKQIQILQDTTRPDADRAKARHALVRQGAAAELVLLGKLTHQSVNVRMHVAIALARIKKGRRIFNTALIAKARGIIAENLDLLAEWVKADDPALRYWAVQAIANVRTPTAVALLGKMLNASEDEKAIVIIARALGSMGRDAAVAEREAILLGKRLVANNRSATMRIAGIEAIRVWQIDSAAVVKTLFQIALTDPEEEVWRAAVHCLRTIAWADVTRNVAPGATNAERQRILGTWQKEWNIQQRKKAGAKTGAKAG